ncbi:MAG: isoprenylcysteine carboxylmethyltransferase family protein [Alphaproteobacteria bacterium]|nr:isoprenylcysteine carboxylmethyltransferase family protein [Alphaproteobacteria bacterium]
MKTFLVNFGVNVAFLGILLLSAGRLSFGPAWVYFAIGMLSNVLMRLVLRERPDLARERSSPSSGAEAWDKRLLRLAFLLTISMLVVAGLDSGRFGWTPRVSWIWSAVGAFVILAGTSVFLLAMAENRFFTAVVRVQRDKGHAVCDSGPYRIIRHPGYTGMIVGTIGVPLLFMSAWSAIPALLSVVLLVVRTRLEDSLLERELEGYSDYQRQTRYRLVPGIW